MITPAQCRKIVDDILFDSFGVYHYVFLEEPLILIGEYNFAFEAKFCRADVLRIYEFTAMRVDVVELLIKFTSASSRHRIRVFFTDEELLRVTISKRYVPNDYDTYESEYAVSREEVIPYVTFTIRDEIGDRHQI